jgi:hypothetical protein
MSFTFSNLLQSNPIKFAMKSSELSWDENHQMKISWLVVLASWPNCALTHYMLAFLKMTEEELGSILFTRSKKCPLR